MEFIDDAGEFARRLPLMAAKCRDFSDPIGLNWIQHGTDIDFGALSKQLIGYGVRYGNVALFGHEVRKLFRESDGSWTLKVRNRRTGDARKINAQVRLRRRRWRRLPCCRSPASRRPRGSAASRSAAHFLRTSNPEVAARHRAKVYGFPPLGAPPMSAPHLDTRIINGKPGCCSGRSRDGRRIPEAGPHHRSAVSVKPTQPVSMFGVG